MIHGEGKDGTVDLESLEMYSRLVISLSRYGVKVVDVILHQAAKEFKERSINPENGDVTLAPVYSIDLHLTCDDKGLQAKLIGNRYLYPKTLGFGIFSLSFSTFEKDPVERIKWLEETLRRELIPIQRSLGQYVSPYWTGIGYWIWPWR